MKRVLIIGADYCPPCQVLKAWLNEGGLDGLAEYEYREMAQRGTGYAIQQVNDTHTGDEVFAATIPAAVIFKKDGSILAFKNGATQTWIKNTLNGVVDNGTGTVPDNTTNSDGANANGDTFIIEDFWGLEPDEWIVMGAVLFIILTAFILYKIKWI